MKIVNGLLSGFKTAISCPLFRCVAVKYENNLVYVADTKNPDQAPLVYDLEEWAVFIQGVKAGEFDFHVNAA